MYLDDVVKVHLVVQQTDGLDSLAGVRHLHIYMRRYTLQRHHGTRHGQQLADVCVSGGGRHLRGTCFA